MTGDYVEIFRYAVFILALTSWLVGFVSILILVGEYFNERGILETDLKSMSKVMRNNAKAIYASIFSMALFGFFAIILLVMDRATQ